MRSTLSPAVIERNNLKRFNGATLKVVSLHGIQAYVQDGMALYALPVDWLELAEELTAPVLPVESQNPYALPLPTAVGILEEAAACIGNRASERDQDEERSMARATAIFNAYRRETGPLSETDGWVFMVCLKLARAVQGNFKLDDYVDGAAYFALAAESEASRIAKPPKTLTVGNRETGESFTQQV